jgi:HSP20 family protein
MNKKKAHINEDMLLDDDLGSMFLDEDGSDVFGEDELDNSHNDLQQTDDQEVEDESEEDNGDAQLAIDVSETPTELIIKARVAGVDRQDLDVVISEGILTISGTLMSSDSEDILHYHYQECYWGRFYRQIALPVPVKEDTESLEGCAVLKEGVLTIRLIKEKMEAARKITIN